MSLIYSKQLFHWFEQLGSRVPIAHKIGYGYVVAISIGFLGSMTGLVIADYYQGLGLEQLADAQRQSQILNRFLHSSESLQIHSLLLLPAWEDLPQLQTQQAQIKLHLAQTQQLSLEMENFIASQPTWLAAPPSHLKTLLNNYTITLEAYTAQIELRLNHQYEDRGLLRKQLEEIVKGQEVIKPQHQQLLNMIKIAQQQEQQGGKAMEEAQGLEKLIIVVSAVVSVTIAGIIALCTTNAIARPLEEVTHVAQRVTSESNFDLRVSLISDDEIGVLANSLNQLIQWVGSYIQQLEIARQTLEKRVIERTTELELSNQKLQQTLQNLQHTQSQLIQTEKMSSLGQMVAGIAHEINNPVNFIHGNLTHVNEYTQDLLTLIHLYQEHLTQFNPEIEEYLKEIDFDFLQEDLSKIISSMNMGTSRIKEIVLSLRNFSRLDEAEVKEANLHEGLDNTLLILNHRLKHGVEVVKQYGDLPLVWCHPAQLNQVFMNILANAVDALFEHKIEHKQIVISTVKLNAHQIQVSIQDNGAGINSEIRHKLFDPFFTTKPVGKGTGLGLSIAYQIVNQHHGKIEVKSEVGKGTIFLVTLPLLPKY